MSRLASLLHLDDGEFPALRTQIEAKPIPAPHASKPPNWGRDMIAFLRAEAPVLDLRAADGKLGMQRPAAPKPKPAADFFAHYADDLRVRMEMHETLQHITGILFESDDALDALIVKALTPIVKQLAELALYDTKAEVA